MKKVFISPYNTGFFSALNDVGNLDFFKTYSPDIQFHTWFYTSLIQTGANFIELVDGPSNLFSNSEYINKRVIKAKDIDYRQIHDRVRSIFEQHVVGQPKDKKTKSEMLQWLIIDILYSLKSGCDLIYTEDVPEVTTYAKYLSPELSQPLEYLFSNIKTEKMFVPSPISLISKDKVKIFSSLVDSDIYIKYSQSQESLRTQKIKETLKNIKLGAEKLVASNPTTLGLYNNGASLIPLTKLVFSKFGKLGNILYDTIKNANKFRDRDNLIIHQYKDISLDQFKSKFDISWSRFEEDFTKWFIEGLKIAMRQKMTSKKAAVFAVEYAKKQKKTKLRNAL